MNYGLFINYGNRNRSLAPCATDPLENFTGELTGEPTGKLKNSLTISLVNSLFFSEVEVKSLIEKFSTGMQLFRSLTEIAWKIVGDPKFAKLLENFLQLFEHFELFERFQKRISSGCEFRRWSTSSAEKQREAERVLVWVLNKFSHRLPEFRLQFDLSWNWVSIEFWTEFQLSFTFEFCMSFVWVPYKFDHSKTLWIRAF